MGQIEIHLLQTFSAANLNRDDANALKTMDFGEAMRQRISSQCMKRATRFHPSFHGIVGENESYRTRHLMRRLLETTGIQIDKKSAKFLESFAEKAAFGKVKIETGKKKSEDKIPEPEDDSADPASLKTLFFISQKELDLAGEIIKGFLASDDADGAAKEFNRARKELPVSFEIAVFGRMAASDPSLNIEAAASVAHSYSVNRIEVVDDYFSAVDDLAIKGESSGAAMIGNTQIACPCFYRYASLDLNILKANLGSEDAMRLAVHGFIEAFIKAIPSGKKTSTAAFTVPEFILITCTDGQAIKFDQAFLKPVSVDGERRSLSEEAALRLTRYVQKLDKVYEWQNGRKSIMISLYDDDLKLPELWSGLGATTDLNLSSTLDRVRSWV